METYIYLVAGIVGLIIIYFFFRRKNDHSNFGQLRSNKSGGDTINATNSSVNTGSGDQVNK
jgi:hypothetical protein